MMAPPTCLRCLSRSLRSIEEPSRAFRSANSRSFSSTTKCSAKTKFAGAKNREKQRQQREASEGGAKKLLPGEAKAWRKRVIISNVNAPEVKNLRELQPRHLAINRLRRLHGSVLSFRDDTVDSLRALDAFKQKQGWQMFRKPSTVIRNETIALAELLEDVSPLRLTESGREIAAPFTIETGEPDAPSTLEAKLEGRSEGETTKAEASSSEVTKLEEASGLKPAEEPMSGEETGEEALRPKAVHRIVLAGEVGCGKSVLQLQAMAMAQQRGWLLIHIPNGQDMTIGHTSYRPATDENGKTHWIQPHYTSKLLGNIAKANPTVLSQMQLVHQHKFSVPVQANISLARLLTMAANDADLAFPVWQAFIKEITTPSTNEAKRPPILITVDDIGNLMRDSQYLDTEVKPIHAHDLALCKHLVDFLGGKSELPNGGMVLACTTESNKPKTPDFDYIIAKKISERLHTQSATTQGKRAPNRFTFEGLDERVDQAMEGVEAWKIAGLDKVETKGIMEYYALSGMLRAAVTDRLVDEKWSVSGGGIIGSVERNSLMHSIV